MTPEYQRQTHSPYQELNNLFYGWQERRRLSNGWEVEEKILEDGTSVSVFRGVNSDRSGFLYHVFVDRIEESEKQRTQFVFDNEGLSVLSQGPNDSIFVVESDSVILRGKDVQNIEPSGNQDKDAISGEVVNWMKKIVAENKFTPLSTTAFE